MRYNYLNGLRGIAAFIVVINHFAGLFLPGATSGDYNLIHSAFEIELNSTPLFILFNGGFSVCLFFILSGYVISIKFLESKNSLVLARAALKRYFRLLPPILFSILFTWVILKLSLMYNSKASIITMSSSWGQLWSIKANFFSAIGEALYRIFFQGGSEYNLVLWTIKYEFLGSLMVFLVLAICGYYQIRYLIYLLVIGTCLTLGSFNQYYALFFIGVLICDININKHNVLELINKPLISFVFIIIGILLGSYPNSIIKVDFIYKILQIGNYDMVLKYRILGSTLTMIAVLNSLNIKKFLELKPIAFLGEISYSMYCIHLSIIGSFGCFVFLKLQSVFGYYQLVTIVSLITLLIVIIVAYFVDKFIDRNGIRLANYIVDKLMKPNILYKQNDTIENSNVS